MEASSSDSSALIQSDAARFEPPFDFDEARQLQELNRRFRRVLEIEQENNDLLAKHANAAQLSLHKRCQDIQHSENEFFKTLELRAVKKTESEAEELLPLKQFDEKTFLKTGNAYKSYVIDHADLKIQEYTNKLEEATQNLRNLQDLNNKAAERISALLRQIEDLENEWREVLTEFNGKQADIARLDNRLEKLRLECEFLLKKLNSYGKGGAKLYYDDAFSTKIASSIAELEKKYDLIYADSVNSISVSFSKQLEDAKERIAGIKDSEASLRKQCNFFSNEVAVIGKEIKEIRKIEHQTKEKVRISQVWVIC